MISTNFTLIEDELPPEQVVVEVIGPSGVVQKLKRHKALWFLPDGSMYVYWRPIMWRYPLTHV